MAARQSRIPMDGRNGEVETARELPSERSNRRYRPVIAAAMMASVAFHLFLFLIWRTVPVLPEAGEPGSLASNSPWKPGGGALWASNVALPEQVEIPPPPRPSLDPDAPVIERLEIESSGPSLALIPASAGTPGTGTGLRGSGGGDGEGSGDGGGLVAAVPRSIVPQWDPPDL